jgi:hypothetical protein
MYGHEVLMSLQTRAKFLGNICNSISDQRFQHDLIDTLWSGHSVLTCSYRRLSQVAVFLLINHEAAVGLVLVYLTMNSCLWIVTVYF